MRTDRTSVTLAEACRLAEQPYQVQRRSVHTASGARSWCARHPELPGCRAWGANPLEALDALAESRLAYLVRQLATGQSVSVPRRSTSGTLTEE